MVELESAFERRGETESFSKFKLCSCSARVFFPTGNPKLEQLRFR